MSGSSVDRITADLRRMAAAFRFKPDERLKEGEIAHTLGVSRTPLREALNRLVAEGYFVFKPGQGFFCRSLTPEKILELYEVRSALELACLSLAVGRAGEEDVEALDRYLTESEQEIADGAETIRILDLDEGFHLRLCGLSGNDEFVRLLENVNGRIRYVRLIDLKLMHSSAPLKQSGKGRLSAHRKVLQAVALRDLSAAEDALRGHIELRREEAVRAVRIAFSHLYVGDD